MARNDRGSRLTVEIVFLIIIVFLVGTAAGFLAARLKYKTQLLETSFLVNQKVNQVDLLQETQALRSLNGGAMMNNGHMYLVKNGGLDFMNNFILLSNGSKLNVDGSIIDANGNKTQLQEGQGVDSQGELIIVYNPLTK